MGFLVFLKNFKTLKSLKKKRHRWMSKAATYSDLRYRQFRNGYADVRAFAVLLLVSIVPLLAGGWVGGFVVFQKSDRNKNGCTHCGVNGVGTTLQQ